MNFLKIISIFIVAVQGIFLIEAMVAENRTGMWPHQQLEKIQFALIHIMMSDSWSGILELWNSGDLSWEFESVSMLMQQNGQLWICIPREAPWTCFILKQSYGSWYVRPWRPVHRGRPVGHHKESHVSARWWMQCMVNEEWWICTRNAVWWECMQNVMHLITFILNKRLLKINKE